MKQTYKFVLAICLLCHSIVFTNEVKVKPLLPILDPEIDKLKEKDIIVDSKDGEEEGVFRPFYFLFKDVEGEINFNGFWEVLFKAGNGLGFFPEFAGMSLFPDFISGALFDQRREFMLYTILNQHFFFLLSFSDENLETIFQGGYFGNQEDVFKRFLFGNTGITYETNEYIPLNDGGKDSMGFLLDWGKGNYRAKYVLQYVPIENGRKNFTGKSQKVEKYVSQADFSRSTFFHLPDKSIISSSLEVFRESDDPHDYESILIRSGNFRKKYKKLLRGLDYEFDNQKSEIFILNNDGKEIITYYRARSGSLTYQCGDSSLGRNSALDGSDFNLVNNPQGYRSSGSKNYLILYQPGTFTNWENKNGYRIEEGNEIYDLSLTFVQRLNHGLEVTGLGIIWEYDDAGYIKLRQNLTKYGDYNNYFPFMAYNGQAFYTTASGPPDNLVSLDLYISYKKIVRYYQLDKGIINDSVHCWINGRKIDRSLFSVNTYTGEVFFSQDFIINANDDIVFVYQYRQEGNERGELKTAFQNTYNWDDRIVFSNDLFYHMDTEFVNPPYLGEKRLAEGITTFQTKFDFPGIFGWDYLNICELVLNTEVSVSHPNYFGFTVIDDMEQSIQDKSISLSDKIWHLGSRSKNSTVVSAAFDKSDRGKVYYKNYYEVDFFGQKTLQKLSWNLPESQEFDYKDGNPTGPYNVADTFSGDRGESLVIDFDIGTGGGFASVYQAVTSYQNNNLSQYHALMLSYEIQDLSGSADMFLEIGQLDEDLDEDGNLDYETLGSDDGFDFNQGTSALLIGFKNNRQDTEDLNKNGILDSPEQDPLTANRPLYFPSAYAKEPVSDIDMSLDRNKKKIVFMTFTDTGRDRLSNTNGIRLTITSGNACRGKLIIYEIKFIKKDWETDAATGVLLKNISPREDSDLKKNPFSSDFQDVYNKHHPNARNEKSLYLQIQNNTDEKRIYKYLNAPLSVNTHKKINLYLYPKTIAQKRQVELRLYYDEDRYLEVNFSLEQANSWKEMSLDFLQNNCIFNGKTYTISRHNTSSRDYNIKKLEFMFFPSVSTDYDKIFIDEIVGTDIVPNIGAGTGFSFSLGRIGPIFTYKDFNILKDFVIKQDFHYESLNFSHMYAAENTLHHIDEYTSIQFNLLKMNWGISYLLDIDFDGIGSSPNDQFRFSLDRPLEYDWDFAGRHTYLWKRNTYINSNLYKNDYIIDWNFKGRLYAMFEPGITYLCTYQVPAEYAKGSRKVIPYLDFKLNHFWFKLQAEFEDNEDRIAFDKNINQDPFSIYGYLYPFSFQYWYGKREGGHLNKRLDFRIPVVYGLMLEGFEEMKTSDKYLNYVLLTNTNSNEFNISLVYYFDNIFLEKTGIDWDRTFTWIYLGRDIRRDIWMMEESYWQSLAVFYGYLLKPPFYYNEFFPQLEPAGEQEIQDLRYVSESDHMEFKFDNHFSLFLHFKTGLYYQTLFIPTVFEIHWHRSANQNKGNASQNIEKKIVLKKIIENMFSNKSSLFPVLTYDYDKIELTADFVFGEIDKTHDLYLKHDYSFHYLFKFEQKFSFDLKYTGSFQNWLENSLYPANPVWEFYQKFSLYFTVFHSMSNRFFSRFIQFPLPETSIWEFEQGLEVSQDMQFFNEEISDSVKNIVDWKDRPVLLQLSQKTSYNFNDYIIIWAYLKLGWNLDALHVKEKTNIYYNRLGFETGLGMKIIF